MYSFNTPGPVRTKLETGAGRVKVSAEPVQTSTVEVVAQNNASESQEAAEATAVRQTGDTIDIVVPRSRGGLFRSQPRLQITVVIPERSSVSGKSDSADMSLAGMYAHVDLRTGSGALSVETTTDDLVAKSGSGDISVQRCDGTLRATTGSGNVQVEHVTDRSLVSSGSGRITLAVVEGDVDAKCGSGDVQIGRLDGELTAKSGSGDVDVRQAHSGKVVASTASGDVTVAVPRGTAVWLDLNTVTGDVSNELDDVESPEETDTRLELRAKTATGDVVISRS